MEFRRINTLPPYVFTIIDALKVEEVVDKGGQAAAFLQHDVQVLVAAVEVTRPEVLPREPAREDLAPDRAGRDEHAGPEGVEEGGGGDGTIFRSRVATRSGWPFHQ